MPAIATGSQASLRQQIRRERAVELAGEGQRLIDLRRWDLYTQANSFPVVGVSLDPAVPAETPTFDNNDIPDYTVSVPKRLKTRVQTRANQNPRYKLWPIPQGELDKNKNLIQNTGW
jgi:hypothetical protein